MFLSAITSEPWRLFFLLAGPFVGTLAATWAVAWPRLPRPLFGGSICGRCGAPVPLWRQMPVVSWALARGARGCCEGRIPWNYPLGEAAGLVVGLAGGLLAPDATAATLKFLLGATLIYLGLVDLRRYVIPVQAIVVVAVLGAANHALAGDWVALGKGLGLGAATLVATTLLHRLWQRQDREPPFGEGDGWLLAAAVVWLPSVVGFALGLAAASLLVLLAAQIKKARQAPMGAILSAALLLEDCWRVG